MNTICSSCLEETSEVEIRSGFHYDYGDICGAWHDESFAGSSCCGEPVYEGIIFRDKTGVSKARQDHTTQGGKVVVQKGELYRWSFRVGFYIDDDGLRTGIKRYTKTPIQRTP